MTEAIEQYRAAFDLVAETPEADPVPEKAETIVEKIRRMSARNRRRLAQSSKERWEIVQAAGVDSGGKIPTREMVERARKILARRR